MKESSSRSKTRNERSKMRDEIQELDAVDHNDQDKARHKTKEKEGRKKAMDSTIIEMISVPTSEDKGGTQSNKSRKSEKDSKLDLNDCSHRPNRHSLDHSEIRCSSHSILVQLHVCLFDQTISPWKDVKEDETKQKRSQSFACDQRMFVDAKDDVCDHLLPQSLPLFFLFLLSSIS